MDDDGIRVRPVGESGLWLDGDPVAEIESKAGDRGVCGVEGCGDEIVLAVKVSLENGTPVDVLEWEHVDRRLGRGGRGHRAELAGEEVGVRAVKVEGETRKPSLPHRDQVMNELWNTWHAWFLAKGGDLRALPQMMFEAMEPFFEGAYEAGQDQWRDWLNQDGVAELSKAAEVRAEGLAALYGGTPRPKFGKWWVSSDD